MTQAAAQQSNPHADTVKRILNEAAGMFPSYPGGPGFWRYVHELAGIEGIEIAENDVELLGPTVISFQADGESITIDWTLPD